MEAVELLERLSTEWGISGYENRVAAFWEKTITTVVDEVRRDRLGNAIALKKGAGEEPRPKVMVAAHLDEIGLMVTKVDKGGFLRFTTVGGFDPRVLLAKEVTVLGKKPLPGVIGAKPPHLLSAGERKEVVKVEKMFIDIGYGETRARELVSVGDPVVLKRRFERLQGKTVAGGPFDDRAGLVVLYETARELERVRHEADVYFVGTVQEEVGVRGSVVSTYGIEPDIGIAVDVGFGDMPGTSEEDTIELGKGPAVALGPNIHPNLHRDLVEVAKSRHIPYQLEIAPGPTGTDARAIQISRTGIATALVSIPLRYMHTTVETLVTSDLVNTAYLLASFIGQVDKKYLEGLKWS